MLNYKDFNENYVTNLDALPSLEIMQYNRFKYRFVPWKRQQFMSFHNLSELEELPIGTVLHNIYENFYMDKPIVFVPDVNDAFMTKDPYRKYICHITHQPTERPIIKEVEEFQLLPLGLTSTLSNFNSQYQQYIKRKKTIQELPAPATPNIMSVVSYLSLYRAKIFGMYREARRFNYIMAALLNTIGQMPDRDHYIPIPAGNLTMKLQDIFKTFKSHHRSMMRYYNDYWFHFCAHLFGFISDKETPSMFEKIPKELWSKIHFIIYTPKNFMILRLDYCKEFNGPSDFIVRKLLEIFNTFAIDGRKASAIDYGDMPPAIDTEDRSEEYDKIYAQQQEASQHEEVVDITRTDIKEPTTPLSSKVMSAPETNISTTKASALPTTKEPVVKKKVIREQVVSSATTSQQVDKIEDEMLSRFIQQPDEISIDPKWLDPPPTEAEHNVPEYVKPIEKEKQVEFNKSYIKNLDKLAEEDIETHTELTTAQRARAKKMSQVYKTVKFDGESIESILNSTPDDTVATGKIECLKDHVADESMLKSSTSSFEQDYCNKMFKRDFVASLVSFNKNGMYLTDIKTKDSSDELNRATTYIVKYEDVHHQSHTLKFTIPDVDERGYCYVNGSLKVLKKQRIPNPICKVSSVRVTLNSDYNKYLVERNTASAHNFLHYVDQLLVHTHHPHNEIMNAARYPNILLPYEFTAIASKYKQMTMVDNDKTKWIFGFDPSLDEQYNIFSNVVNLTPALKKDIEDAAKATQATLIGVSTSNKAVFMHVDGSTIVVDLKDDHQQKTTFVDLISEILDVERGTGLSEWTNFKLLNKQVPTIFALCYRYGLTNMLAYTNTQYTVHPKGARFDRNPSDVVVRFADSTLVIPRVPLTNSLLFAGLMNYDLRRVEIAELDEKSVYADLIQSKGISIHNLKGIDNYFDYFVDPITADVLNQMGEPTDARDLLIRATQLLSTEDHKPASASCNHRFRSYERINSAVYKTLTRAHGTYKYKAIGASNKFSIADYEIKQLICQDQLMENVDVVNPINDIKYSSEYSHGGFGGRQSTDTFMVDDRQFPKDGVGIISEATVDSSKTAYAAALSADPTIQNMRGMTLTEDTDKLKPAQILSTTALLVPGVNQDDGKRANFINGAHDLETFMCIAS